MEDSGGNSSDNEIKSSSSCPRGHWRPAEDEKLRKLVEQYGPQNWNSIAEKLQGRSGKSCRLRWFNQLDPRINRKPFTEEEEERLLTAHRIHGNKWALISRLFPGRTDNAVKNHWHVIMARMQRERSKQQSTCKKSSATLISPNNTVSSNITASSTHNLFSKTPKSHCNYGTLKYDHHHYHGLFKFDQQHSHKERKGSSKMACWSFAPPIMTMDNYRGSSSTSKAPHSCLLGNWLGNASSSSMSEHSNSFNPKFSCGSSSISMDGSQCGVGFGSYGVNYSEHNRVVVPSYSSLFGQSQITSSTTTTTTTKTSMKRSLILERLTEKEEEEREDGGAMTSNTKDIHFIDFLGVGISS
ncbi:Transcription factor MYB52 [Bienertia sinuspersici]